MGAARIMIIDDEQIVGNMARMHLVKEGFEVETFLSAAPALERLEQARFDVVVTDLKMKGIDGMEVLRTIKTVFPEIKVIMITAFASLDSAVKAMQGKVDGFFATPVKIKDLTACIQNLLAGDAAAPSPSCSPEA